MGDEFNGLEAPSAGEDTQPTNLFEHIGESGDVEYKQEESAETTTETTETQETATEVVEQTTAKEAPAVKTVYTPEEVAELLQSDGEIDTDRLSPEGQAVMKSMQRAFTPKLQEAAELRKEMERVRQEMEAAKPKEQPKDIYEAYDQDPSSVTQYVNGELARLINEDASANAKAIEELRDLKTEFVRRDFEKLQTAQTSQRQIAEVVQAVQRAVPDIASKQQALGKFAVEVLGYTPEELAQATDPGVAGMNAAREIARINSAYERFSATTTVKQKETKPKATQVETPGTGFEKKETNHADLRRAALRGEGSWRDVFMDLGDD